MSSSFVGGVADQVTTRVSFELTSRFDLEVPSYYLHQGRLGLIQNSRGLEYDVWNHMINDRVYADSEAVHAGEHVEISVYEVAGRRVVRAEEVRHFFEQEGFLFGGPQLLTLLPESPKWEEFPFEVPIVAPIMKLRLRSGEEIKVPTLTRRGNGKKSFELVCPFTP